MNKCETNYQQFSLRFYPLWDCDNTSQIIGLINMVEFIFDRKPDAGTWVEVGSFNGESSSLILGFKKVKKLYCIDSWTNVPGYGDFTIQKPLFFKRMRPEVASGRCVPMEMSSAEASASFPAASVDAAYLDGDHSYEFVKSDLEHWFPKVKKGGFLCGHDYLHGGKEKDAWPGVTKAVDEFVASHGLPSPILFDDSSYLIPV
jgi:hypothetical protein